jgi:hypothetical protein
MIAYKRLVTGGLAFAAGIAMIVLAFVHGRPIPGQLYLALVLFFGGGAWAFRDGLRLRRELQR